MSNPNAHKIDMKPRAIEIIYWLKELREAQEKAWEFAEEAGLNSERYSPNLSQWLEGEFERLFRTFPRSAFEGLREIHSEAIAAPEEA